MLLSGFNPMPISGKREFDGELIMWQQYQYHVVAISKKYNQRDNCTAYVFPQPVEECCICLESSYLKLMTR